jgi:hypothetical protein
MTPILGILASGISGNLWAPGKDFDSIATVSGSGVSSVSFTSIPSTYRHLQIRYISRSSGSTASRLNLNMNGDTTSTFTWHSLYGTGASAAAYAFTSAYIQVAPQTVSTDTASAFAVGVIDILDYKETTKFKTVRSLAGDDMNGSGLLFFNSGAWGNTNAITSIAITPNAIENFASGTTFALYGIK